MEWRGERRGWLEVGPYPPGLKAGTARAAAGTRCGYSTSSPRTGPWCALRRSSPASSSPWPPSACDENPPRRRSRPRRLLLLLASMYACS
ncbi:unnamed protein product [Triticum turgidum subsp. durum]|uniref:Uncharacterized protein n=1 Tax=Triticum turgidum subsp. durum TaxID=4567 RepID=A0A9R0W280_TRITD|nr:unnamed protein product [Triticum turgidum subsp. durum]